MNAFASELQQLADRLALPEPARTRVLAEVAADLEDLFGAFQAAGRSPEDARRLALERCDLSDDAVAELAALYAPPAARWLDGIAGAARPMWERVVLGAVAVLLVVIGLAVVARPGFVARGSGFVWPLAGLAVAATAALAGQVWRLGWRRDHRPRTLHRVRVVIPALALAMVVCGAFGFWWELATAARRLATLASTDPDASAVPLTLAWLERGSGLMVASLALATVVLLGWQICETWARRCQQAALAASLDLTDTTDDRRDPPATVTTRGVDHG
jgi:hypothetical protein